MLTERYWMEGSSRALGSPGTITIGERTYRMRGLGAGDYGECEQQILQTRRDPFAVLATKEVAALPAQMQQCLAKEAMDIATKGKDVTSTEVVRWMDTMVGAPYTLWMCLRDDQPEITLERARELFDMINKEEQEEKLKEFLLLREQLSGTDQRGNSTGQQTETTPPESESESPSTGEK